MKAILLILCILSITLEAQVYKEETLPLYGKKRSYIYYIPKSYNFNGTKKAPVIINLYGRKLTAKKHFAYASMVAQAEKHGAILIYPQSLRQKEGYVFDTKPNSADLGLIVTILKGLGNFYRINENRIYCVGFETGGMMAYSIAQQTDMLAAVGVVSGNMTPMALNYPPKGRQSVLIMHDTSDWTFPYNGKKSAYFQVAAVDEILNYWKKHLRANKLENKKILDNLVAVDGSVPHYFKFMNEKTGKTVVHYKFIGGGAGSSWPGNPGKTNQTNYDINASEAIAKFFSVNRK